MILLPIHVVGGILGVAFGFVAIAARKGGRTHRRSGMWFVYSMLAMAVTGTVIALLEPNPGTAMGGVLTIYLIATSLRTVRRDGPAFDRLDVAIMLLVLVVVGVDAILGVAAMQSPTGKLYKYPPGLYFTFGSIALIALAGDVRALARGITASTRLARHLWRMCFAMFIGTGSFFLGKANHFPKAIRIMPALALLAFLPLIVMIYWLVRTLRIIPRAEPLTASTAMRASRESSSPAR